MIQARKPIVLVLLSHYLPGYKAGGPIRSIANMVEALGDELDFRILTSDRDIGQRTSYEGVATGCWTSLGNAQVFYAPDSWQGLWTFIHTLLQTPADLLYLNSFFGRRFSMLALFLRWLHLFRPKSVLLAPRGEFSTGALQIKSWRKRTYVALARGLGFYSNILWHASSQFEQRDIHNAFCSDESIAVAKPIAAEARVAVEKLRIMTALDLPETAGSRRGLQKPIKPAGTIRLLFLSRISRKKNLDGAIRMLRDLRGDVRLDIFGPVEDEAYWRVCRELISQLPANVAVQYCGEAEHDRVHQVLSEHDVLLFPTHGENYGHVIREALSAGCPVIISDQTPWRELETLGVGWDVPLRETDRFRNIIQACIEMEPLEFAIWSRRASDHGSALSRDPEIINQNRKLFMRALSPAFLLTPAGLEVCL
jgi:glycosyltransferase involved in cell wall biosynthesis